MDHGNVQSQGGITLVGGGDPRREDVVESVALAPTLVAVDGGANFCVAAGFEPRAVIGDFDSLRDETRAALPDAWFIEVQEQISTDFEKSLTRVDAPFVLATGFTEGRLDHTLAVFSALVRQMGPTTILIGREDIVFAVPDRLELDIEAGVRLSLFPMAPVRGRSSGLHWPIEGLRLDPMGRIGTSNVTTGPVTLTFDRPGCLCLLPRAALLSAIAGMTGQVIVPGQ